MDQRVIMLNFKGGGRLNGKGRGETAIEIKQASQAKRESKTTVIFGMYFVWLAHNRGRTEREKRGRRKKG